MKKLTFLFTGVVFLYSLTSCMDNKQGKNYNTLLDQEGTDFIHKALEAGLTEIQASKLAETNSKDPRVISFAKMMIADHSEAGDELQKIAIKNKVTGGDSVSTDHQKAIAGIAKKTGPQFDKLYIQMMVNDHQAAVKLFTGVTDDKNIDVYTFAQKTLPIIKMHLDSANAICGSLK